MYRESDLGYVVIVNQVHQGLVYKNEVFTHLHIGQFIEEAFVKKIREDNLKIREEKLNTILILEIEQRKMGLMSHFLVLEGL